MKLKWMIWTGALAAVVLLSGCAGTQPNNIYSSMKVDMRIRDVKKIKGTYYSIPRGTGWKMLNRSEAKKIAAMSGGKLRCRSRDLFVVDSGYSSTLNKYNYSTIQKLYKRGKLMCQHPMSKKDVNDWLALDRRTKKGQIQSRRMYERRIREQQRLANDPRVVAARIQANAQMRSSAMMQQQMQQQMLQQQVQYQNQQMMLNYMMFQNNMRMLGL